MDFDSYNAASFSQWLGCRPGMDPKEFLNIASHLHTLRQLAETDEQWRMVDRHAAAIVAMLGRKPNSLATEVLDELEHWLQCDGKRTITIQTEHRLDGRSWQIWLEPGTGGSYVTCMGDTLVSAAHRALVAWNEAEKKRQEAAHLEELKQMQGSVNDATEGTDRSE